ncbi:MAG: glycosyltransferase [Candidatus Sericytochromatia bacterium]|nr:glycosyltransferase [Candidatus Sericytochromatia bacterium]
MFNGKNDFIKKIVKDHLDRSLTVDSQVYDVLAKDLELKLEPILSKASSYAQRENRDTLLPGDVIKSINYHAGKKSPRILIAHVTAGAGHQRAAEAIGKAYSNLYPDANVKLVDTLDYINTVYKKVYSNTYLALVKHTPRLWGYIYDRYDNEGERLDGKLRQSLETLQAGDFRDFLDDFSPDAVICTHFLPMELISRWKKKRKSSLPVYAVVTDFALHTYWIVEEVNGYFVANDDIKRELQTRGAKVKDIYQTGIPVDPVFAVLPLQHELRDKLGLERELPTVLLMGGGYGVGDMVGLLRSFRDVKLKMQLMVVCGRNESLFQELNQVASTLPIPTKVFGFVTNVHELMRASDLMVTKPGGLSSSEALAANCPMMIMNPIPGQEQRNSDFLLENGAASILHNVADGAYYIEKLLKDKERLALMIQQARKLGRKDAAMEIARTVMKLARLEEEESLLP